MTYLWKSQDVDEILRGQSSLSWECSGVSIDTRTLQPGDLFVALQGEAGDGHAFLKEAAQRGASAALVSQDIQSSLSLLKVEDTLEALGKLGAASRDRSSATRLAVTGSVGKTSTKEMLKRVLEDQGPTHGSVSSYNNHWGVPLTLARMPQETKYGIFELGMNHTGEIRPLTQMVRPHLSLITTIEMAHAQFFKSIEDIALAKAEIFEGMEKGSPVVLNKDNALFSLLAKVAEGFGLQVYGFGKSEGADFRLLSWESETEGSRIVADINGQNLSYFIPLPGFHQAFNSLAVLGAISLIGADLHKACESFRSVNPAPGRGNWHKGSFTLIDESYNANPASMRAALSVLGHCAGGRKVAVLGDMREMGDQSQAFHEELLGPLLENKIDTVYCCGPFMAHLYEKVPDEMKGGYASTSLELIPLVLAGIREGDIVSVKGSLGTRMKPIVEALLGHQLSPNKRAV